MKVISLEFIRRRFHGAGHGGIRVSFRFTSQHLYKHCTSTTFLWEVLGGAGNTKSGIYVFFGWYQAAWAFSIAAGRNMDSWFFVIPDVRPIFFSSCFYFQDYWQA